MTSMFKRCSKTLHIAIKVDLIEKKKKKKKTPYRAIEIQN